MLQRPSLPHMPGPQPPTSPPHNSHPVPHPSSPASPCCHLCLTTHKPMAASIFTTCQSTTITTTTPSLHTRSAHNANSPHVSPAMMPSQHGMQGLPCASPTTVPPQHKMQDPKTTNPPCTSPTMVPPQHEMQGPATTNPPCWHHGVLVVAGPCISCWGGTMEG